MLAQNSTPMFVSLDPDDAIDALVRRYKRQVRELVGGQLYLEDPPHVTAYFAIFEQPERVADVLAGLTDGWSPVELVIDGWHVFENDPLTGNQTLVLEFDLPTQQRLRNVQKQIISALATLRDVHSSCERYEHSRAHLTVAEQRSIDTVGFPFTGDGWHPHLTIASIRREDWPTVAGELLAEQPQIHGTCSQATLYSLQDSHPVIVNQSPFRACEVLA